MHLNIKGTKVTTAEGRHNFNTDNEDAETVEEDADLGYVTSSSGDGGQEIKTLLGRARAAAES